MIDPGSGLDVFEAVGVDISTDIVWTSTVSSTWEDLKAKPHPASQTTSKDMPAEISNTFIRLAVDFTQRD
jgi:hypothetical protein